MKRIDLNLGISDLKALQLASWAEMGMRHPKVTEDRYGLEILAPNESKAGHYVANFLGFTVVGCCGEPAKILETRALEGADFLPLLSKVLNISEAEMLTIFSKVSAPQLKGMSAMEIIKEIRAEHGKAYTV